MPLAVKQNSPVAQERPLRSVTTTSTYEKKHLCRGIASLHASPELIQQAMQQVKKEIQQILRIARFEAQQ